MIDAPKQWRVATLGEVALWGSGGTPRAGNSSFYGGAIGWAVSGDLNDGPVAATASTITPAGLANSSAKLVQPGAVLIAMYGATIGKLGIAACEMATNQAIAFATPREGILDNRFLFWWLRFQRDELRSAGKGAAQPNISQQVLKAWPIPIPPIEEQRIIVAAIEEQLARLEIGRVSIDRAQRRMGALTVSSLRAVWDRIPAPLVRLDSVSEVRLGRQRSPKNHSGTSMAPYLRAANVGWTGLRLGDIKEMNFTPSEREIYRLHRGDILLSEASGSPAEVGKPALWMGELADCCFQNTLLRVRCDRDALNPRYLLQYLRYEAVSGGFARVSRGVGIHHLGAAALSSWRIPCPPLDEQAQIAEEIELVRDGVARLVGDMSAMQTKTVVLRHSVLASAFTGRLVPIAAMSDSVPMLAGSAS